MYKQDLQPCKHARVQLGDPQLHILLISASLSTRRHMTLLAFLHENREEVVICEQCPVLDVRFNLSHRHHYIQLC